MSWKRFVKTWGWVSLLVWLALTSGTELRARGCPLMFEHQIIDDQAYGDGKALGDINGDGFLDVILAGRALYWYPYPEWQRTLIAEANVEFTTEMQVGDIDNDGDLDIVVPDGPDGVNILWFENPRPDGDARDSTWTRHPIGPHGNWAHDVEVGDLNGDGLLDVVTRAGWIRVWIHNSDSSWAGITIDTIPGYEGLALADFEGDGDLDIATNGYWIETPADPLHETWNVHTIDPDWPRDTRVTAADLNADGRSDVAIAISENADSRIVWYEAPPDPVGGVWAPHLVDDDVDYVHTLRIGDFDADGNQDILFAEMAQSDNKRVGIYLNTGDSLAWNLDLLADTGTHNAVIGDLGNDGDLDIIGANWQGPPLELWDNQTFRFEQPTE